MVPMKTKNRPNAKERATSVIVLGEAISFLLAAPGASERNDWKMHQGGGLLEAPQTWRRAGPICGADAGLFIFHRKQMTSATTHFLYWKRIKSGIKWKYFFTIREQQMTDFKSLQLLKTSVLFAINT